VFRRGFVAVEAHIPINVLKNFLMSGRHFNDVAGPRIRLGSYYSKSEMRVSDLAKFVSPA
jgi:hypothetical protein